MRSPVLARVGAGGAVALAAAAGLAGAALVAPATSAPVRADTAEPTPVEVFRRHYRDRDPAVRRKAVQALAEARGGAVVEALLLAARDEDERVRDRAESLLLGARDRSDEVAALVAALVPKTPQPCRLLAVRALAKSGAAAAPGLHVALGDKDDAVRAEAASALGAIGERSASPALHELLADRAALVRAAACDALGRILGADAVGAAAAVALGDRAPEPRIAAVGVLAKHPSAVGEDAAARCLGDGSWSARTAAARALAEFGGDGELARAAVAALVPALERESRMRVRVEMAETLWTLTAVDFGPDPGRWTHWFRETGGRFEPPAKRPRRGSRGNGATFGGLADLPLESDHVCFVFDASSSMNDPVRFGVDRTKRDELKEAFSEVLARLPRPSWINVVPFATEPMPMKPALFEATQGARAAALKHLTRTAADGRTNIYDAVAAALADPDADTIVLLTDGAPSAGKRTQRTSIVDGVREMNRYRLARIHTVEIGAANTGARWKGFLQEISDATGGHHLSR